MRPPLTFVYVLRSVAFPTRYYSGLTSDVRTRLETHNSGGSQHTLRSYPSLDQVVARISVFVKQENHLPTHSFEFRNGLAAMTALGPDEALAA